MHMNSFVGFIIPGYALSVPVLWLRGMGREEVVRSKNAFQLLIPRSLLHSHHQSRAYCGSNNRSFSVSNQKSMN